MNREEVLKIAKPILFNTEMVQAILEGRKTVTRRVLAEKEILDEHWGLDREPYRHNGKWYYDKQTEVDSSRTYELISKHKVGDILYVRESYCPNYFDFNTGYENPHAYKADYDAVRGEIPEPKWKPSIHMHKEMARIFLKVTDIRVERLRDICHDWSNFNREGIIEEHGFRSEMHIDFIELWDSTTKKEQYKWKANPWVWVIEFERIEVEQ